MGVASNADGEGIHVINDHRKYKEWEFIYDIKNDKTALGTGVIPQQIPSTIPTPTPTPNPSPTPGSLPTPAH